MNVESLRSAATDLFRRGDHPAAGAAAVAGLAAYPDDPELLRIAGNAALVTGDEQAALGWYARAIAADPRAIEPRVNTGLIHLRHHRPGEARRVLRECLAIDPDNRAAWLNLAATFVNEGRPEEGETVVREALRRCGDLPDLHWNLALVLLERQVWREGWRHYAARAALPGFFPAAWSRIAASRRLADLPALRPGARVICHGEQGLGDEILFAGMLREFVAEVRARGASVEFACNPRLRTVFGRNLDVPVRAASESPRAAAEADWIVAIGDLGRFVRNEPRDFPAHHGYLTADPARVKGIREELVAQAAGRPLVGIAWTGGRPRTHAEYRRIPLEAWLPLVTQAACFVSLQYTDDDEEDVSLFERRHGIRILRLPHLTRHEDYAETFALVAALDLIVTVPTSVLHVAGAVGRECWVVMDERAAWRECATGGRMPWYPLTHERFVRPADATGWNGTLAAVAAHLTAWNAAHRP